MDRECAKLVLKSTDLIAGGGTNSVGTSDTYRVNCTWSKVNMKDVLGDMFDKYDVFNLRLVEVYSGLQSGNLPGATVDDRDLFGLLSGLRWKNQSYDTATRCNTEQANLGHINYVQGSGVTLFNIPRVFTFTKAQPILTDLTISLKRVDNGATPTIGDRAFSFTYYFEITGVESSGIHNK
jgi:hypothetical protein